MAAIKISFCFFLLISLTLLLNKVNSTQKEITSFYIPKFVPDQNNLIFQGDGYTTKSGKLQLTKVVNNQPIKNSLGRALYSAPIHIWDSKTNNVANFETSFTFVITAPSTYNVADGFAFFLAPIDSQPQIGGGYLGVFKSKDYDKSTQTVAFEVDTFTNVWDPNGRHIGIDVNSITSISTKPWSLRNGQEANVVIRFNGETNVLSVSLTYGNDASYTLSDVVNVREVLPEWVRIGFSGTTGAEFAAHDILSWSFHSELSLGSSSKHAAADDSFAI